MGAWRCSGEFGGADGEFVVGARWVVEVAQAYVGGLAEQAVAGGEVVLRGFTVDAVGGEAVVEEFSEDALMGLDEFGVDAGDIDLP
ncbi:hypothetical protein SHKM778_95400 (plasmid) [Streptomyces sp. KM77-8]|uniref:Uncharacterized protein n=1 Tax=Streptomyces haneummycinicus TaxID=3074435 RepID=A0AAT9HZW7_9ACTN